MSETRPPRPTLALIVAIWLLVVGCFGAFGLVTAAALTMTHTVAIATLSPLQLGLTGLSVLLALGGGIMLLQMKPLAGTLLLGRFAVELILLILVLTHPAALPANLAGTPNAAAITSMAKTGGAVFGIFLLLVNLGIALYARGVTCKTAVPETIPVA